MKSEKINIVIINVNYYGIMASSQRVKNLMDGLLLYYNVDISNITFNTRNINNDKVKSFNLSYDLKNPFSLIQFFRQSKKTLIKIKKTEIINVLYFYDYPSIETLWIIKRAKRMGYYVVFDIVEKLHAFDLSKASWYSKFKYFTARKMLKQIPKLGNLCFAISHTLVEYCSQICRDIIPVVHLPISVNEEYVSSFKKEKNKDDIIRVFYGGSFGFKDGIDLLIQGFSKAALKLNDIELILTGKVSKQMQDSLNALIQQSPVMDRIHYLGCLTIEQYYETMVNMDILCMTRVNSDYANAGFPFKLGEYLASGNAIIATRTTDIEKYLIHKKNAYIIEPNSPDSIANAILELTANVKLRTEIGTEAPNVAKQFFSLKGVSEILYDSVLKMYDDLK